MDCRTREIVVVIHSLVEGKEDVAFRVEMRPQQVLDVLQKTSYSAEIFGTFMQHACALLELDMAYCTADALFPDIPYNAQDMGVPEDLLRPQVGMYTTDFSNGEFLLH